MDRPFAYLDGLLSSAADGHGLALVLVLAFALGLRHAADPDHLVAVSTIVATSRERGGRLAARLGAAWGVGHALTLLVFGLPVVLLGAVLPEPVQRGAEALIGLVIVLLALRLLVLWRRGAFHVHEHEHETGRHAHVHAHAREEAHGHGHPVRTTRQAFALGTVHGLAGSAGVTLLLLAAVPAGTAALALAVLAGGTALSMSLLSFAVGSALGRSGARAVQRGVPVLGWAALLFGAWYALAALAG
jgi:ABC-type nickel/cobalt efflux system permease component RcnA